MATYGSSRGLIVKHPSWRLLGNFLRLGAHLGSLSRPRTKLVVCFVCAVASETPKCAQARAIAVASSLQKLIYLEPTSNATKCSLAYRVRSSMACGGSRVATCTQHSLRVSVLTLASNTSLCVASSSLQKLIISSPSRMLQNALCHETAITTNAV